MGLKFHLQPAVAQAQCASVPSTEIYDYIALGSGAGGTPIADRLSKAGHKVLLIEKGPPSTGRWGRTMKPNWLEDTNLTRFDVPGLCIQIWDDPTSAVCTDIDQMAWCMLGGGTAVNAGLWWKPHPPDWDVNLPEGWRSKDVAAATERVFSRMPGTITPSMDGKRYMPQGFGMLTGSLKAAGWQGPVRRTLTTYLVTASGRKSFTLWINTIARRVVRDHGHATGVEVECNGAGHTGVVPLTPDTGRVIISAGAFGSATLLFRSGIGPTDQLNIKNSTNGSTVISSTSGSTCRWL
ncbi:hypothetical protein VTI74DRAFT_8936 [Chaetomium olivicolor]